MNNSEFDKNGLDKSGSPWIQYVALTFISLAVCISWAYYNGVSLH